MHRSIRDRNFLPIRSKKAGNFEKLLGFARSHSIVTRGSVSLSCATTPHISCFSNSQRHFEQEIPKFRKSSGSRYAFKISKGIFGNFWDSGLFCFKDLGFSNLGKFIPVIWVFYLWIQIPDICNFCPLDFRKISEIRELGNFQVFLSLDVPKIYETRDFSHEFSRNHPDSVF